MVQMTDAAAQVLAAYFGENNFDLDAPMRIVKQAGCGGTALALAFDDPGPADQEFKVGSMVFVVDRSLLDECGAITVDFVEPKQTDGGCGCSCGGGGKLSVLSSKPLREMAAAKSGGCGCSSGGCG